MPEGRDRRVEKGGATRRRMVTAAAELFRRRGYHGTGVLDILEAARAPRGSMYHHFPGGKPELAAAATELAVSTVERWIDRAFQGAHPGRAIEEFLAGYADRLESTGWEIGCPVGAVAADAAAAEPGLREQTGAGFERWQARLAVHLIAAGHTPERAGELAALCVAALEGALIVARAERSGRSLRASGTALSRLLAV